MITSARSEAAIAPQAGSARRVPEVSREAWLLAGLTILAAVLRFATITSQSFWVDESQAVHEFSLSFGGMLSAWSHAEGNPPLYFVFGWAWAKVFGTGELGLRSLSALVGTALIPVTYLCGRELVSRRAGLLAAAFAAVNPFLIWYSQEAREYMLLALLSGLSLLYFARAWQRPSRRDLVLWTVFSGLALLTQYFAAFLIAGEALAVLWRLRSRAAVVAAATLAVIEAALIPHVLVNITNQLQWVVVVPLSVRIQQVPVAFGLNTLYQSPIVNEGLLGAAALAAVVIALLVAGADARTLRGAGVAAALAAVVVLLPILLALLGHDDYVVRGLIPAWIPLAVVLAAACTAAHARIAGALLAIVLLAAFVYAGVRIDSHSEYQRSDWRRVAAALGTASGTRAIVAYDGEFATGPLSIYLPRLPWAGPGQAPVSPAPVTVSEVDIVGSADDTLSRLPAGVRRIAARTVNGYQVDRFALAPSWRLSPAAIGVRAAALLTPGPVAPSVLIEPAAA